MRYLFSLLISSILFAQVPSYYSGINFNESPENIKSQLALLVRNTHLYRLSYTPQTWYALKQTDLNPENPENVLLIYGYNDEDDLTINDRSRDKDLSCHTIYCTGLWSREHVYPRSIGNYDENSWPGSDIHALRPSDGDMNEYRSNSPFVAGSGNAREMAPYRFYPGDEWKGDVARMMMYMYLRYPDDCLPNFVGLGTHQYHPDMPDIFLEWNATDPVSEIEMNRNNLSENGIQGNRNPFIDNPFLATMIWGGPAAHNTWGELQVEELQHINFSIYPNPTQDYIYYNEESFDQILILDVYGRIVGKDADLKDSKTKLPETPGIYFIKFYKGKDVKTIKTLKK
ncbi:MAG: endonuclease [Flavobacteriaceae bacterium]|nr:endonuclease [Flavobacteriaceae bacterium]